MILRCYLFYGYSVAQPEARGGIYFTSLMICEASLSEGSMASTFSA